MTPSSAQSDPQTETKAPVDTAPATDNPPTATAGVPAPTPARRSPPTICRMVVFHGHGHPKPEDSPAVVRSSNADGTLNMTVFGPRGSVPHENVVQGAAVGQWDWPL